MLCNDLSLAESCGLLAAVLYNAPCCTIFHLSVLFAHCTHCIHSILQIAHIAYILYYTSLTLHTFYITHRSHCIHCTHCALCCCTQQGTLGCSIVHLSVLFVLSSARRNHTSVFPPFYHRWLWWGDIQCVSTRTSKLEQRWFFVQILDVEGLLIDLPNSLHLSG